MPPAWFESATPRSILSLAAFTAATASWVEACTRSITAAISRVESDAPLASSFTFSATTANARPCSPACDAMIAALSASSRVLAAISSLSERIEPIARRALLEARRDPAQLGEVGFDLAHRADRAVDGRAALLRRIGGRSESAGCARRPSSTEARLDPQRLDQRRGSPRSGRRRSRGRAAICATAVGRLDGRRRGALDRHGQAVHVLRDGRDRGLHLDRRATPPSTRPRTARRRARRAIRALRTRPRSPRWSPRARRPGATPAARCAGSSASSASVADDHRADPRADLARELAQVERHALERGREHGDLAVALARGEAQREVAARDALGGLGHRGERSRDPPPQALAREQARDRGQREDAGAQREVVERARGEHRGRSAQVDAPDALAARADLRHHLERRAVEALARRARVARDRRAVLVVAQELREQRAVARVDRRGLDRRALAQREQRHLGALGLAARERQDAVDRRPRSRASSRPRAAPRARRDAGR